MIKIMDRLYNFVSRLPLKTAPLASAWKAPYLTNVSSTEAFNTIYSTIGAPPAFNADSATQSEGRCVAGNLERRAEKGDHG